MKVQIELERLFHPIIIRLESEEEVEALTEILDAIVREGVDWVTPEEFNLAANIMKNLIGATRK